jgi:hypothetical protein
MATKIVNPGKKGVRIIDAYSVEDDYEVEHNGSTDPNTGRPMYTELPVRGGHIVVQPPDKRKNPIHFDGKGNEIDPEDISPTTKRAKILKKATVVSDSIEE